MVTRKQVYRYFAHGKGFASRKLAYMHVARKELAKDANKYAWEREREWRRDNPGNEYAPTPENFWHEFYAIRFPNHEDTVYPNHNYRHTTVHEGRVFCNGCYKEWLSKRAEELMAGESNV